MSVLLLGTLGGCAAVRPPIQTEAALGKVVVYRNGVAYFERRAVVKDGQLRLTVPVDRVDDFLKSLKVVDAKTGESLPVSFKTMEAGTDQTEMIVSVPGKEARELLVSYVTDSPAWKPSYRVVLGKKAGRAELEAWAVVDNVSGEDWKRVTIGVGSTSALSFRYDLHSVRLVERQTLGDEAAFAGAPPIGGSPYAVASAEMPIVGALGGSMVDRLLEEPDRKPADRKGAVPISSVQMEYAQKPGRPASGMTLGGEGAPSAAPKVAEAGPSRDDAALDRLAFQIRNHSGKVKLQGFARAQNAGGRPSGGPDDEAHQGAGPARRSHLAARCAERSDSGEVGGGEGRAAALRGLSACYTRRPPTWRRNVSVRTPAPSSARNGRHSSACNRRAPPA